MHERHDTVDEKLPNKNVFTNNFIVDIFLCGAAIISLLVTNVAIYLLCKHKKLRTVVASLALQQLREVGTVTTQKECKNLNLYDFGTNKYNFRPSDFCSSTF